MLIVGSLLAMLERPPPLVPPKFPVNRTGDVDRVNGVAPTETPPPTPPAALLFVNSQSVIVSDGQVRTGLSNRRPPPLPEAWLPLRMVRLWSVRLPVPSQHAERCCARQSVGLDDRRGCGGAAYDEVVGASVSLTRSSVPTVERL